MQRLIKLNGKWKHLKIKKIFVYYCACAKKFFKNYYWVTYNRKTRSVVLIAFTNINGQVKNYKLFEQRDDHWYTSHSSTTAWDGSIKIFFHFALSLSLSQVWRGIKYSHFCLLFAFSFTQLQICDCIYHGKWIHPFGMTQLCESLPFNQ